MKRKFENEITNNNGHNYCKSWIFDTVSERDLANAMAKEAAINGVGINEFRYTFTMTLRMLKSNSRWSK